MTLEVPSLETGVQFYIDAGLIPTIQGDVAGFRCAEQDRDSIVLLGGAPRKRLHRISLRADDLGGLEECVPESGGKIVSAPHNFYDNGLWITDPHGMLIQLVDRPPDEELRAGTTFAVNAPGHIVRERRSAMLPGESYPPAKPQRLGHILLFSPDVLASVAFMTDALGMDLADRAQDIEFCCATKDSDHHVVAFAKAPGIGFHHARFQVADPDEVGVGAERWRQKRGTAGCT